MIRKPLHIFPSAGWALRVALTGFSVGFFLWALAADDRVFRGFFFANILEPSARLALLFFLAAGVITLVIVTLPAGRRGRDISVLIFPAAGLFFIPFLEIPALEYFYPFRTFFLTAGLFAPAVYTAFQCSAGGPDRSFKKGNTRAFAVVAAAAAAYALFFSVYTVMKHRAFHSYAFDLGWYNQTFYTLLKEGIPYVTLHTTIGHFDNHTEFIFYLLAPVYALFRRPETLLIIQTIFLAAGAVPVYLLARRKFSSPVLPAAAGLSYLLYPALQGMNTYDFHGLTLVVPIMLFLLFFLETGRKKLFWLFVVLALLTREDVPVTLTGVGLYIIFFRKDLKQGILLCLISAGYFLAVTSVMNALEATENYTAMVLPESPGFTGILKSAVTNPLFTLRQIFSNSKKLIFLFQLFLPVLFLPLAAGGKMILLLPAAAILLLADKGAFFSIGFQYSAHLVPLIYFLTLEGLSDLRRRTGRIPEGAAAALLILAALGMSRQYGLVFSKGFQGFPEPTEREMVIHELMERIPPDAPTAADARVYPHLSGRKMINLLYRVDENIDYVLADLSEGPAFLGVHENIYGRQRLSPEERRSIMLRLLAGGEFGVLEYRDGVILLKRGADISSNREVTAEIRGAPAVRASGLPEYYTDPTEDLPEPLVSVSDAFIAFLKQHSGKVILVAVEGDATKRLSLNAVKYLAMRGAAVNSLKPGGSYAAVIAGNRVAADGVNNRGKVTLDTENSEVLKELFRGQEVRISSAGDRYGNRASIVINGTENAPGGRGFNLVVLDRGLHIETAVVFDMEDKYYHQ